MGDITELELEKKASKLEHWKGALAIIVAMSAPWGLFATGEATLLAAAILCGIAGLTSSLNWVNDSLTKTLAALAAEKAEKAEKDE